MADISTFFQQKDSFPLSTHLPFVESSQKYINGLLKKEVFELSSISEVSKNIKIFNCHFEDEIHTIETVNTFEKLKLVV